MKDGRNRDEIGSQAVDDSTIRSLPWMTSQIESGTEFRDGAAGAWVALQAFHRGDQTDAVQGRSRRLASA
jgi:hypothetical protein